MIPIFHKLRDCFCYYWGKFIKTVCSVLGWPFCLDLNTAKNTLMATTVYNLFILSHFCFISNISSKFLFSTFTSKQFEQFFFMVEVLMCVFVYTT